MIFTLVTCSYSQSRLDLIKIYYQTRACLFNKRANGAPRRPLDSTSPNYTYQMFKYPLQDRLFEALSKHDKSLGEHEKPLSDMYRGGLHVFGDSANPDRIAQSAHSFRELIEKAPEYINVPQEVKEQRAGYSLKPEVVDIKSAWAKVQERSGCYNSNSSWSGEIDPPLTNFLKCLCQFFKKFEENRLTKKQVFTEFRQGTDLSPEALPNIIERLIYREWGKLYRTFTKICHHRHSPEPPEFEQYIEQLERILIAVLVPQTVSDHEAIKQEITILEKTTIKHGDVKCLLRNHIKRTADFVYFYENISSPDWIDPLFEEKAFSKLPEPVEEGDFVKYPRWPEGQYLLQMARSATDQATQELIAEIIASISDSKNQHAESVRVQVATALPPKMALRFVKKLQKRLPEEEYITLAWAHAIINLALHITKAGHVIPALDLLKSLLKVLPDPRPKEEMPLGIPETKVAIDRWRYAQLIEEDLPAFVEACGPFEVLKIVLCPLLDQAVKLNMVDSDEQSDSSIVWRSDIQEPEIYDSSPHQLLTTAVINTAVQAVGNSPQCIRKLVLFLEEYASRRPIFARIVLHLLSQDPGESQDLITDKLTSQHSINNVHLWAEYANLLKQQFPNLSAEQQNKIVKSILAGPQLEGVTPQRQGTMNDNDGWILTRLHLISDHLSRDASKQYRSLLSNYPDPKSLLSSLPPIRIKSWIGPTSPLSDDEMAERSPLEMVKFLREEWSPTGNWDAPTPEGLSRILAITVEKNAASYANEANAFSDLEPTYIKALFYGLTETGQKFPWEPVLQLCKWVVDQPRDYDYADQHVTDGQAFDRDPDWGWTRKSIAHLLKKGLRNGLTQIPYDYQEEVWYICEKLLCDPDPTLEYEQQYGEPYFDFTNMAINTVRGTTMHVVMAFIEWSSVHPRKGVDPKSERRVLSLLPEVRQVLNTHLSVEFDPSLAIRAVYGEWFIRLYQVDKGWASGVVPILFPLEKDEEYFLAAWCSYCLVPKVDIELFELLRDQYEHAIALLKRMHRHRMGWEDRMGAHLARLFAMEEEVSSVQETIDKFFEFADDRLRSNMVRRMTGGFEAHEEKKPTSNVERIKRFWDQRLTALEMRDSSSDSQLELEAYGNWFQLDSLYPEWALKQLLRTLKLAKNVMDWPGVCGKLADLSQDYPRETTECVRCLAEGGNRRLLARTDNCGIVLSRVMNSGNEEAIKSVREVVDFLVAKGFSDYRSVIDSSE